MKKYDYRVRANVRPTQEVKLLMCLSVSGVLNGTCLVGPTGSKSRDMGVARLLLKLSLALK